MFADLLMFSCIYYFTFYTLKNITNKIFIYNLKKPHLFLVVLFTSLLSLTLKIYITELTYIVPLLFIWILLAFKTGNPKIILYLLVAFFISYTIWAVCSLVTVILFLPVRNVSNYWLPNLIVLSIAILHVITIKVLLAQPRFKKGIPFQHSTSIFNILTTISILFINFFTYKPQIEISRVTKFFFLFPYILLFLFLIHWWQAQITKSYKRSLQLRELESLRMELEDKEKRITELEHQNKELGRLIHKDNKLIPAMEHAVHEYFITNFETLDEAKVKAESLLLEIETLSKNRNNIILEINSASYKHYETGVSSVDTLLNYMDKRAKQEHISFSVHLGLDLSNYVPKAISAENLTHMLSDLIENAIIACKSNGNDNANIQLQFYVSEKAFVIEIADNGIPFEIDSLVNFGITQLTTHADTGGSGIGLMDIWKIKEKYFASLHITEFEESAPFTKKIAIIFNKKHRYSISSKRQEELVKASKRADLHIFN